MQLLLHEFIRNVDVVNLKLKSGICQGFFIMLQKGIGFVGFVFFCWVIFGNVMPM